MPNSPEHQPESFHLHSTLRAITKAIGLAAAAMLLQSCDGKNPNEVMLQMLGSRANASTVSPETATPEAEEIRKQCASAAAEEAGIRIGTEGLDVLEEFLLRDALTGQCLEDRGVILTP